MFEMPHVAKNNREEGRTGRDWSQATQTWGSKHFGLDLKSNENLLKEFKKRDRTSLVVQWLRPHLQMQGMWV